MWYYRGVGPMQRSMVFPCSRKCQVNEFISTDSNSIQESPVLKIAALPHDTFTAWPQVPLSWRAIFAVSAGSDRLFARRRSVWQPGPLEDAGQRFLPDQLFGTDSRRAGER